MPFPCDGPLAISPAVRRTLVVIEAALIFLDDARRFEEAQGERHATAPLPDRIGPYQGSGSGVSTAKGFASGYEYIVSLKYKRIAFLLRSRRAGKSRRSKLILSSEDRAKLEQLARSRAARHREA